MGSRRVGGQLLERRAERHGEGLKASMVRMDWKVEKHREERRARCRVLLECPQHHLQWKWCLVLNRRPICTLPISVQLPTDDTSLYGHVNDMDLLLVAHSCDEAFCKPKGTGNSPARSSVEDAVNEAAVALSDLSLKETGLDDSHSASPASLLLTIRPIIAPAGFEAVALVVQPSHNGFVKGNGCKTAVVHDERMCSHALASGFHPEQPARITSLWEGLVAEGMAAAARRVPARLATKEEILMVHEARHWDQLEWAVAQEAQALQRWCASQESLYLNAASMRAARLASGAVMELTQQVMRGEARNGLAIVRPPGHHAEAHRAMGFCVFNSVAVAAAHARSHLGARRVLIVDWDIHHGNGIQRIFEADPSVLYFSVHRYENGSFFPGCPPPASPMEAAYAQEMSCAAVGSGQGEGTTVNVGWNTRGPSSRPGDAEYEAVWSEILMPIAREFAADLVLVAAGFDAAEGDPLGGCHVTPEGYHSLTRQLMELAGGKLVLALEGGYSLSATTASATACMAALLGLDVLPSVAFANDGRAKPSSSPSVTPTDLSPATLGIVGSVPGRSRRGGVASSEPSSDAKTGGSARATPSERQERELRRLESSGGMIHAQSSARRRAISTRSAPGRREAIEMVGGRVCVHPLARKSIDDARAVHAMYWKALRAL